MKSITVKIQTGEATHTMMGEDFKLILEAAAFTTTRTMTEIKGQTLGDLVKVDKNNPVYLDTSRLDEEIKTYRNLQKRLHTITSLLNGAEKAEKPTGKEQETPLHGKETKNPEYCRIDADHPSRDCGCAFGQCVKGLIE